METRVYKLKELMPSTRHLHTERAKVANGKTANGRPYYPTVSYEYFKTPSGDMELSEWLEQVKKTVAFEGFGKLYRSIIAYCRENCAWLKTMKRSSFTLRSVFAGEVIRHGKILRWKLEYILWRSL